MKKIQLLLISIIFSSCQTNDFHLVKIDFASTRKSYHRNYSEPDAQAEKRIDSIQKANPELANPYLEKAGLIKNGLLQVDMFKQEGFIVANERGDLIKIKYVIEKNTGLTRLSFQKNGLKKDYMMSNLDTGHAFLTYHADIIKGGYDEIVTLDQWYIVNGDNFDVTVYEIR